MSDSCSPSFLNPASLFGNSSRAIRLVNTPLGFATFALGIVETFLLGAGIFFQLSEQSRLVVIGLGVILFLVVYISVIYLVRSYPSQLLYTEAAYLQTDANIRDLQRKIDDQSLRLNVLVSTIQAKGGRERAPQVTERV